MLKQIYDYVKSLYCDKCSIPFDYEDLCRKNYNEICNDLNISNKKRRNYYRLYKYIKT
jgi:hypothetical protein